MEITPADLTAPRREFPRLGVLAVLGLTALLWVPVFGTLMASWRSDPSASHGPLVLIAGLLLLWSRRDQLREWNSASGAGAALLIFMALVHAVASWADVECLKPLSLIGMMAGIIWCLGGWRALSASAGALGALGFMIPWPTSIVDRLAFPLQLISSSYAALTAGILGLPIQQEGVQLHVMSSTPGKPIFSILVAEQCSGLSSLLVLLFLGYLIAYFTNLGLGWRALIVALVAPVALLTNTVRLTLVLLAGTYHSVALAHWVHDNEAPVLVTLSSLCLLGIRQGLLAWQSAANTPDREREGEALVQVPLSDH